LDSSRDTIYALSSGGLPSGVAVVRLSGPGVDGIVAEMAGDLPAPRKAVLRTLRDRQGSVIDSGLIVRFPAPHSFTGEDVVEFQLHGSRAVVAALFRDLAARPGLRAAEAGEFSRRAFDNGRLDLVEIEGLADLISAETEMQRRLALDQAGGRLSTLYEGWAEQLTRYRALIEAELDFPEEEDIPGSVSDQVWPKLRQLADQIERHIQGAAAAEIIRDGFRVAIVGAPNVGKSSLLNALARRDIAIVTDIAGTTRDVLGVDLDIGGYLVHVMDTAGIRETDDLVEREGVRRTFRSIEQADLVLLLSTGETPDWEVMPEISDKRVIPVQTKSDLLRDGRVDPGSVPISALTGEGLDSLTKRILDVIDAKVDVSSVMPARERQVACLRLAHRSLKDSLDAGLLLELRAEHLRKAGHSLGKITGRVDVEDLLAVIFSEFCVGK
jgi:tRNA modification GTPase